MSRTRGRRARGQLASNLTWGTQMSLYEYGHDTLLQRPCIEKLKWTALSYLTLPHDEKEKWIKIYSIYLTSERDRQKGVEKDKKKLFLAVIQWTCGGNKNVFFLKKKWLNQTNLHDCMDSQSLLGQCTMCVKILSSLISTTSSLLSPKGDKCRQLIQGDLLQWWITIIKQRLNPI